MFNLLIKGVEDAWDGYSNSFELDRCIRPGYTADGTAARLGSFDQASISILTSLPTIFAYEKGIVAAPKFGRITAIKKLEIRKEIRFEYELIPLKRFISNDELWSMEHEFDLVKLECRRSHWAVKNSDLSLELSSKGIELPSLVFPRASSRANVEDHKFEISFSFPGEYRPIVEKVYLELKKRLPDDSCFYDFEYQSQLARPSLDLLLQDLYGRRSRLIVVFIGTNYQNKMWPNIEWNAIRPIINTLKNKSRIMYVRVDDGQVDGISSLDGYIDAKILSAEKIAELINDRLQYIPLLPLTA